MCKHKKTIYARKMSVYRYEPMTVATMGDLQNSPWGEEESHKQLQEEQKDLFASCVGLMSTQTDI